MPIPLAQVLVAEVSYKGQIEAGGSNAINTNFIFHFKRSSTAVDPTKSALHSSFRDTIGAPIAAALNDDWAGRVFDIRWVNDAEDPYVSFASTQVGAITGDRLPSTQAAYLLHRTALRGRSFRGSKHLGPMSESDIAALLEDVWGTTTLTRLAAINTALITGFIDSTGNIWKYTLLSRKLSQISVNPTVVVTNEVTQGLVNKRAGTMLRRKVKSVY